MYKLNRKKSIRDELTIELAKENPNINAIVMIFDEYEKSNLQLITKLKRCREVTTRRILGGLKQSINAHGPITKELMGSAVKRIYGNLINNKPTLWQKIKGIFK